MSHWTGDDQRGVDYERSFRLNGIDHDNELVVRGELPGVEKNDIVVMVMGDRLMMETEREFEDDGEEGSGRTAQTRGSRASHLKGRLATRR